MLNGYKFKLTKMFSYCITWYNTCSTDLPTRSGNSAAAIRDSMPPREEPTQAWSCKQNKPVIKFTNPTSNNPNTCR